MNNKIILVFVAVLLAACVQPTRIATPVAIPPEVEPQTMDTWYSRLPISEIGNMPKKGDIVEWHAPWNVSSGRSIKVPAFCGTIPAGKICVFGIYSDRAGNIAAFGAHSSGRRAIALFTEETSPEMKEFVRDYYMRPSGRKGERP